MERVALNSLGIYFNRPVVNLHHLRYIAWFHDIYDHKYDHDGSLRHEVEQFLKIHCPTKYKWIMSIIDQISFTNESNHPINLPDNQSIAIRNIVSDVDKWEAIGYNGLTRCIAFTLHKNNIHTIRFDLYVHNLLSFQAILNTLITALNHDQLLSLVLNVNQHSHDKLLLLKDNYFHTELGKSNAIQLHDDLVNGLRLLNKLIE